ncbi:uncharacterized protein LOC100383588 [Zea mays]|jgi:hypothetical protein|uniref:Plant basic secretory protein (BSP) family protein n=1 Tax=Zea mays TaxID=4577 RepID=C0PHE4_MAIZE|nr:uncharacterized protein LOC100383588 [Zea mays]ACN34610.1 unknown [Zea mays]AQK88823.1 Plant basic secretory protein (BSP) family protein [Zea mays]|eukprot:NP_001169707.1 uncharacterized protein LOC100383588 [Zea mays]
MDMDAEAPLLLPIDITIVPSAPSSSPSTRSIVLRIAAVLAVACASLLAQHEASKGFAVAVANDAARGSAAARRFDLHLASNGRAERALLRASRAVERALFPDASFPRRQVRRVTVRMAARNLTAGAGATVRAAAPGEYVVSLSPGLVASSSASANDAAVAAALRRAVARMWLWDGRGAAPARVTEAMVDYLAGAAGDDEAAAAAEDAHGCGTFSARLLRRLEARREGFVARLNRAMKDRWSDAAVDAALGAPARLACRHHAEETTAALTRRGQLENGGWR